MNIKKKSIIIPAFALLIGASLAGSVTGTVAWYQYSTRVNAAYVGVSGGTSGNLQMRIKDGNYDANTGDWETFLTKDAISAYLDTTNFGGKVLPVTSGNLGKEGTLGQLYSNPVYGLEGDYATAWKVAPASSYIVLPLQLRFVEKTSANDNVAVESNNIAKSVYLTDLYIASDAANATNGKDDISSAIRFYISAYSELTPNNKTTRLVSKNGGTTMTSGKLDLDGDGNPDVKYDNQAVKYGFSAGEGTPIQYGEGQQVAFSGSNTDDQNNVPYLNSDGTAGGTETVYSTVADGSTNPLSKTKYNSTSPKSIGETLTEDDKYLNVDLTIWFEGWQTLEDENGDFVASWDIEKILNSKFDIGFEFAAE